MEILANDFGKRKLTKALAGQHRPFGGPLVGPKLQDVGSKTMV